MFYGIKYLIVTLVFSHLGFWSGNLFLIASFPDLCLLVPYSKALYSMVISGHYQLEESIAKTNVMTSTLRKLVHAINRDFFHL